MPSRKTFSECMAALLEVFASNLSPRGIQGYWAALKDLTDDEMNRVTAASMSHSKYMPRPAELAAYLQGDLHTMAEDAWFSFRSAFVRFGASRAMTFEDPVTAAAVRAMGGLGGLARGLERDFSSTGKRDFVRAWIHAYRELEARVRHGPELDAPSLTLAGCFGSGNPVLIKGRSSEPPAKRLKGPDNRPETAIDGKVIQLCSGPSESFSAYSQDHQGRA